MREPTIPPALTSEEWKKATVTPYTLGKVSMADGQVVNDCCGCRMPPAHALAAFALHGQSFGFSREDVEMLRRLRVYNLAARIEALLCPEDPKP